MLLLVRAVAKKPRNLKAWLKSSLLACSARVPKVTALIDNLTCRVLPDSVCSDSWSSTKLVAGTPAGV